MSDCQTLSGLPDVEWDKLLILFAITAVAVGYQWFKVRLEMRRAPKGVYYE